MRYFISFFLMLLLISCWAPKYRTYSINDKGEFERNEKIAKYDKSKKFGTTYRDFQLIYPISNNHIDTIELKQNAKLLFSKIDKKGEKKYFKDFYVHFNNDSSGFFVLNTWGFRDRTLECSFKTVGGKCNIQYRSYSSKF